MVVGDIIERRFHRMTLSSHAARLPRTIDPDVECYGIMQKRTLPGACGYWNDRQ
jgi:hypothetical protein